MFFCKECGSETSKWSGKCPVCGAWNSLKESSSFSGKSSQKKTHQIISSANFFTEKPEKISEIKLEKQHRLTSGIDEFDGTLGGGIVPGMVVLIGGEPGIGKSTLLLQIAERISRQNHTVLYVSGEESKAQIKLRAQRTGCISENLLILTTGNVEEIIKLITEYEPKMIVIDSIQSVYWNAIDNSAGSVAQLRECTAVLSQLAKRKNIPVFLIGHVTKTGSVAGPKIIEHIVDTVLYFEGETKDQYKILRTTKNRFGSTNEIGVFEMNSSGLQEVKDISQLFIHKQEQNSGSAIGCMIEGSRAFLIEVQALVSPARFGVSQRVAVGFDQRKLAMLLAVIEKKMQIDLKQNDVFINITGGIKLSEPALDLAIVAAIISSFHESVIPQNTLFLGEIGLNGEIRPVSLISKRINEAEKLGFGKIVISNKTKTKSSSLTKLKNIDQLLPMLSE